MGNGKIYVGIPRERVYLTQFVDNRDAVLARLQEDGLYCAHYQAESHRVDRNRDVIVKMFLDHPDKPEWLLMIDSDMEHPEYVGKRLARWNKPIVGGLYFHRGQLHDPLVYREAEPTEDEYGRPTLYWIPMRDQIYDFLNKHSIPMRDGAISVDGVSEETALLECDALGTGTIMIHRSVLEQMEPPWFEYITGGNSEDLVFCKKARELGIPIYCDLSTISGHYHWVAMGQAQFRMNYENRGLNLTAYKKSEAAKWYAEFFDMSFDEAVEAINNGNAHMVGDLWNADPPETPNQVKAFYEREDVGQAYIMELIHWNYTTTFTQMRKLLTNIRASKVLEIGAGIGTVALQLIIQGNDVLATEINPMLRSFIDLRFSEIHEKVKTDKGQLVVTGDDWTTIDDDTFDYVIAFDVLEHLSRRDLRDTVAKIARVLKLNGHFIFHNNWHQQDLYPMHFDHEKVWLPLLNEHGFVLVSPIEAIKTREK